MSSESDPSVEDAREPLERLYDDPDRQIQELLEHRLEENALAGKHAVFQALANKDRLRLLEALRHDERCGCELMVILDAPQSTVSTHLRKLREAGLVKNRKKGKWNYYRIADPAVMDILDLAAAVSE
ncbi:MAG: metalloregulator ArsR/SmtB family transcription factor [Halobacteriales archaeon]|nr:metalloregulator ArsR/SmtB family transcription factor [Halobacteriales archaeon]